MKKILLLAVGLVFIFTAPAIAHDYKHYGKANPSICYERGVRCLGPGTVYYNEPILVRESYREYWINGPTYSNHVIPIYNPPHYKHHRPHYKHHRPHYKHHRPHYKHHRPHYKHHNSGYFNLGIIGDGVAISIGGRTYK